MIHYAKNLVICIISHVATRLPLTISGSGCLGDMSAPFTGARVSIQNALFDGRVKIQKFGLYREKLDFARCPKMFWAAFGWHQHTDLVAMDGDLLSK
jgi:hypothetical protein